MKRIMSFMLVLVIMLSILPLAAFADDSVEPRAYTTPCPSCGRSATVSTTEKRDPVTASPCNGSNNPAVHHHEKITTTYKTSCPYCGYNDTDVVVRYYCITTGRYISESAFWSL